MGGGRRAPQQTVTQSGIDPEFKPYLERVLSDVTDRYESDIGKLEEGDTSSVVAALDPAQESALKAQQALSEQAIAGTGAFDYTGATQRDMANLAGTAAGRAAMGGSLGSARNQAALTGALADRSMQIQQQRVKDMALGTKGLGEVGSTRQAYEQQKLDAPGTVASRYFGYLGSAPQQQTQTTTGGGGK
tara:strand:- start:220 stop:786 length:567 start_codon:yes stop_codon:yes gene_type:complete